MTHDPTNPFQDRGELKRELGRFCNACQAIPVMGYCRLAGCPTAPKAGPRPMSVDACLERLTAWAMSYAVECEEDGIKGVIDDVNRDQLFLRSELDWASAMSDSLPEHGVFVPRPDLALGALQVAAKADQLDVATCFAQTAIDFLTGNYDPDNFDLTEEEREALK